MSEIVESAKSWDQYFLEGAAHKSSKSKDPSTKAGSVIVRPDMSECSSGMNGLPRGVEDTIRRLEDRDLKYKMCIHAETNAILFSNEKIEGYTVYVWPFPPCSVCAAYLIQKRVGRIVAPANFESDRYIRWKADFDLAEEMYAEAREKGIDIQTDFIDHNDPMIEQVKKFAQVMDLSMP